MRASRRGTAALLVALALVVAACGSDGDDGQQAESTTTEPAPEGPQGSFVAAAAQGIESPNPFKAISLWEFNLQSLIWATLTRFDPDTGTTPQPYLAESWESSVDQKVWTFALRQDAVFSDGSPIDASTVVANAEHAINPATACVCRTSLPIETVRAVDEATVEITLTAPDALFPANVTWLPIVPADSLDAADGTVTSGPYVIESFMANGDVVLTPNELFYSDHPATVERLTFTKAQDNASAVAALRAGSIQSLWQIPFGDVRAIGDDDPDIDITLSDIPTAVWVVNHDITSPPFDNPIAREALAHAINREAIVETVFGGHAVAATASVPVAPDTDDLANGLPTSEFDLELARELFEDAGVGEGATITLWLNSASNEMPLIAQILQDDLKTIGINAEIEVQEVAVWAERFAPAGKSWGEVMIPTVFSRAFPWVLSVWKSGVCSCNWNNGEYDEALATAAAAADDAERADAYKRAQELFAQEIPSQVILFTSIPLANQSGVSGVWTDPMGRTHYENATAG